MTGGNGKSEDLQGIQAVRGGTPAANFSKNMRKTRPLFQRREPALFSCPGCGGERRSAKKEQARIPCGGRDRGPAPSTVGGAGEAKHIGRRCAWKAKPPREDSITAVRQKSKGAERANGALQRAKTRGGRQRETPTRQGIAAMHGRFSQRVQSVQDMEQDNGKTLVCNSTFSQKTENV